MNRDEISRLELLQAAHPDGLVFPHLADAYRRAGRYAQAESVLNAGLRRHSDYSSAHVVLGRLRLDQGKHLEAEQAFRRVLELDPQNQIAVEYLARVSLDQGRLDEALDQFRRLARLKPSEEVRERVRDLTRRVAELREGESAVAPPGSVTPAAGAEAVAEAVEGATDGASTATASRSGRYGAPASGGATSAPGNGSGNGPARAAPDPDLQETGEEAPLPGLPEPGEVVTETMAELYTRQGLYDRAAAVYRQLLDRAPDDSRLRDKLRAVEAELGGHRAASPLADDPADPPEPSPRAEPVTIRDELSALLRWTLPEPVEPGPPRSTDDPATDDAPWATDPAPWATDPAPWAADPAPWAPDTADDGDSAAREAGPPSSREPAEPDEEADFDEPWLDHLPAAERESATDQPELGARPEPAAEREPAMEPEPVTEPEPEPVIEPEPVKRLDPGERQRDGVMKSEWESGDPLDSAARSLIAITDMLVGLLEYRDPFFRGSSSLTRLVAEKVAEEMGLTASQRVDLSMAAVLRDLGRLALGGRLVSQSGQQQSQESRRKIERHVDLALDLLEGIELPHPVRLAVRHHHERWDGAGYPDQLAGSSIPLLARVLAVVDSFAAMVSPRSYRLPRKVPDAARELQKAAGTQYDPEVVEALLRVLDRQDQPHLGFAQRPHLLLVNPDQPGAVVTAAKLCSAGYLAEVSPDPAAARERLRRVPVAALVVSAEAGEEAAAEFVRELRVDPLFSALPVVVVDADSVALRVRLLESGADVCFPPGTSYAELQGTLSALVRRTLRAGRAGEGDEGGATQEAPWLALQGDIKDFPLTWLLQVMKYDSRTAAIGIRAATADGAIYLQNGDAVHAQIRGSAKGEPALRRMLQWQKGRFTVHPDARPRERTIETSIMHLLLTQAVDEDHAAAGIFGAVSDES